MCVCVLPAKRREREGGNGTGKLRASISLHLFFFVFASEWEGGEWLERVCGISSFASFCSDSLLVLRKFAFYLPKRCVAHTHALSLIPLAPAPPPFLAQKGKKQVRRACTLHAAHGKRKEEGGRGRGDGGKRNGGRLLLASAIVRTLPVPSSGSVMNI